MRLFLESIRLYHVSPERSGVDEGSRRLELVQFPFTPVVVISTAGPGRRANEANEEMDRMVDQRGQVV